MLVVLSPPSVRLNICTDSFTFILQTVFVLTVNALARVGAACTVCGIS
jgi:hypothetical protein